MKTILPLLMMFVLSSCASEYYHRSADGVYYADGDYYNYNQSYDSYYGYPSYYSEYGYSGNSNIYYSSYYPDRWGVSYNSGRYGPYRSSFIRLGFGFSSSCYRWSLHCSYPFGAWYTGYSSHYYWGNSPWFYNDWWWYNNRHYYNHRYRPHRNRLSYQPNRNTGHKPNEHRYRRSHEPIELRRQPAQRSVRRQIIDRYDRQEPRLRSQNNRRINTPNIRGAIPTQQPYNRLQTRPNLTIRDINTSHSARYNKPLRQNSGSVNRSQLRVQQYNKPLRQSIPNRPARVQQYHKPTRSSVPVRNTRSSYKPSVNRRSGSVSSRPTPPKKSQRSSYSKIR